MRENATNFVQYNLEYDLICGSPVAQPEGPEDGGGSPPSPSNLHDNAVRQQSQRDLIGKRANLPKGARSAKHEAAEVQRTLVGQRGALVADATWALSTRSWIKWGCSRLNRSAFVFLDSFRKLPRILKKHLLSLYINGLMVS